MFARLIAKCLRDLERRVLFESMPGRQIVFVPDPRYLIDCIKLAREILPDPAPVDLRPQEGLEPAAPKSSELHDLLKTGWPAQQFHRQWVTRVDLLIVLDGAGGQIVEMPQKLDTTSRMECILSVTDSWET